MSLKALPLLFVNLGGEMVYILQQRLTAQAIDGTKSQKVLNEIVSTMFNRQFMDELFKPQELYSKKAVRTIFDRLAHSSIMRLNSASMDKLYDLMTMAVKYQMSLVEHPRDVILVTLNHIDGIRAMLSGQAPVLQHVDGVYNRIMQTYDKLSDGEFQLIRQTLLAFFQDIHVRVSIFLKEKQQLPDGHFAVPTKGNVPHGTEVPGAIRYFDSHSQLLKKNTFNCDDCGPYALASKRGSRDLIGDRATSLGTNLYSSGSQRPIDTSLGDGGGGNAGHYTTSSDGGDAASHDPLAKAQLDLLCHLIGGGPGGGGGGRSAAGSFRLNLFSSVEETGDESPLLSPSDEDRSLQQKTAAGQRAGNVVTIDAARRPRDAQLAKIMGDMSIGDAAVGVGRAGGAPENDRNELLDLMDRA